MTRLRSAVAWLFIILVALFLTQPTVECDSSRTKRA